MSKRKKEIRKRQREAEDISEDESFEETVSEDDTGAAGVSGHDAPDLDTEGPSGPPVDDSQIVSAPRPTPERKKSSPARKSRVREPEAPVSSPSWFSQKKENLLLGVLVFYVILLGLGTVGELFEIEWILNLPLFK